MSETPSKIPGNAVSAEGSSPSLLEGAILDGIAWTDPAQALDLIRSMRAGAQDRGRMERVLPSVIRELKKTSCAQVCLVRFARLISIRATQAEILDHLAQNPRAIEILIRIFVSSDYLSQILFRHPQAFGRLMIRESLMELKSREQFRDEALLAARSEATPAGRFDALRKTQREELLRIGTCDAFGLMDLRSVIVQLSLLADGLVQACLRLILEQEPLDAAAAGFVVLACGKLGGEELNYSSDIDLIFLTDGDPAPFWPLGQRLIQAIANVTAEGFLYRVDMRLRPWGNSGPLVNSVDAHLEYLRTNAQPWECQALLKARVIAGDQRVGARFLRGVDLWIYRGEREAIRSQVRDAKRKIEEELVRKGHGWGEVKSGEGSLRDIEFVAQFLQLSYGRDRPELRTFNTLDALVRLAEFGFLRSDEYRQLSTGYLFLRKIEHALQLMHNKQLHRLPENPDELASLAGRLDFPSGALLLRQYESHRRAIRRIFTVHLEGADDDEGRETVSAADRLLRQLVLAEPTYAELFDAESRHEHRQLLESLSPAQGVAVSSRPLVATARWQVTVVGRDARGILSLICGLMFSEGLNIVEGRVFTDDELSSALGEEPSAGMPSLFLNYFTVEPADTRDELDEEFWGQYAQRLRELHRQLTGNESRSAPARVARRAALRVAALRSEQTPALQPVRLDVDNVSSNRTTILNIRSEDTPGFLYELTNALTLARINIVRMSIGSENQFARDTLFVTDELGRKIEDETRLRELTTAILLIKHCMHLLPAAPNPETAWLHLRDFLEQLFQQPDWHERIGDLEQSQLVATLTGILGVSDYLWQDFLRLHHDSVLPFVQQVELLQQRKTARQLRTELRRMLRQASTDEGRKAELNRFKDRETFRTDMRHLLGYIDRFDVFSEELTDVCEVTIAEAVDLAERQLRDTFGSPIDRETGRPCPLAVFALGKCGGRELGFASDIELLFVYAGQGKTDGARTLREAFFFERLIKRVGELIVARREGIFELDLRLRPFGSAGPLAVSREAFADYFSPTGPAWPYERQALVKLRQIAGDRSLGKDVIGLRDRLLYRGEPFDITSMRGMREKQIVQLVDAGEINAKLSPGGLVDVEYLVQGLQIAHGHRRVALRIPNTLAALAALRGQGILDDAEDGGLRAAYEYFRRLIDALRMVRGNARDLTIPERGSDEFEFLARRLGFSKRPLELLEEFETHSARVLELSRDLEERGAFTPQAAPRSPRKRTSGS